jgi:lysine 2,3-aminomutase
MPRLDAWRMIRQRALTVGILAPVGDHWFRGTGIAAYLAHGGALAHAREMAAHESPRTSRLHDRTKERLTQDEAERIRLQTNDQTGLRPPGNSLFANRRGVDADKGPAMTLPAQACRPTIKSMPVSQDRSIAKPSKILKTREELGAYDPEQESWNQQLTRRYTHHSQLAEVLNNVEDVPSALYKFFSFSITPYIAQLMDPNDPTCPIRRQYLPTRDEMIVQSYELRDSLAEETNIMATGSSVVHRYPRRVLFLVQNTCGAYCRYCTRKRMVSNIEATIDGEAVEAGIRYIASHPEIEDVLLSGGDPLILSDRKLDEILGRIRIDAPHVRLLRIGSRLPVQLPTRVTEELCGVLLRRNVQMVNLHINHPKEITKLFISRITMLRMAGVMLGNQSVLLRGVNDSVDVQRELCMKLVEIGIRPYYVYSNDGAEGNSHFTVLYDEMVQIVHGLRGWISGPAVPTFVVDGVGGLGKMPVAPGYLSRDAVTGEIWGTNYRGQRARQRNIEAVSPVSDRVRNG